MKDFFRHCFSLILPVTALIVVPWLIESDFRFELNLPSVFGITFIAAGLTLLVLTIRMFVMIGRGTLAPWDPTRKLVTGGLYGYMRNPMITGVFIALIGEAILFGSVNIAVWAAAFFLINTVYFILSEEPGLEKRFGDEYHEYKKHVPRWVPRLSRWSPKEK